jgi:hypothetical protein
MYTLDKARLSVCLTSVSLRRRRVKTEAVLEVMGMKNLSILMLQNGFECMKQESFLKSQCRSLCQVAVVFVYLVALFPLHALCIVKWREDFRFREEF